MMTFKRIRSWWALRRLTAARRMSLQWQTDADELRRRLKKSINRINVLKRWLEFLAETVAEDLDQWDRLQRRHETAIESLQNENRVLSEVLVPSLTTAHQLVLARYDAEVAIQARRQAMTFPGKEE